MAKRTPTLPPDLSAELSLGQVRQRVNAELTDMVSRHLTAAEALDPSYGRLWRSVSQLLEAGGKRLRPYLAVLAYRGLGGAGDGIYRVAAAHELLHLALLIHDDVIDRDYARHGRPNVAGDYLAHYTAAPNATHLADSAAILAGDALLGLAYDEFLAADFPAEALLKASRHFGKALFEASGGQLLDLEAGLNPADPARSLRVASLKTASYSFIGPLSVGAALAAKTASIQAAITAFGTAAGIGFQLADDLLGLYGTTAQTGKPTISDLREGKATYLIALALAAATPADRAWLHSHWGNPKATSKDLTTAKTIVTRTGAKAHLEADLRTYAAEATRLIGSLQLQPPAATALAELIPALIWREN